MSFPAERSPLAPAAFNFNVAVGAIGLLLLAAATVALPRHGSPELALPFFGLFVFARFMRFEIPPNITASLIVPLQLAGIVLLGPVTTAWIALPAFLAEVAKERALVGLTGERRRAMLGIVAFNLGMEALMTLAGGVTWLLLMGDAEGLGPSPFGYAALLATFAAFKLVNETLMVAGSWFRGRLEGYVAGARTTVIIEVATLPLGALLIIVFASFHVPAIVLLVATVLLAAGVVRSLTRARTSLAATNADLERKVREVETLARVGRAISEDIELDRLLESVHEGCQDTLRADHFFIALWQAGEGTLRIALEVEGGRRQPPKDIPLGTGLTSHVIASGQPLLVRDLLAERTSLPAAPILRLDADQPPNLSWLGVPMIAKGETVGAIVLQDPRPRAFDEDDMRVLSAIAAQAAISVKNARLHQEALRSLRIEEENRQLKLLNAKKSEFVNMVAHQFRTPLTAVIGYANLVVERVRKRGGSDIPDLERHLTTVHSESKRLADMVEELLNVSRIRSGRLTLVRQHFDLVLLAKETIASHQVLADERSLRVDVLSLPPGAPVDADGDSNHVRQAFANVLANALKYAPEGSRIEVLVEARENDARISVTDEGPGVPEADLERVFDEFYRAGGPTAELPGTGLGLSIARGIVEAHGGAIGAQRHGTGTTFWFTLPHARAAAATTARAAAARAEAGS